MEKFLFPNHLVICIIAGPSECGKSVFLTNLVSIFTNEYIKMFIYSTRLHQGLYQKLYKCFINYIPIHIIPKILNEEDIVIEGIVIIKDFEKSDTEVKTYESIEEMKFPKKMKMVVLLS